MRKTFYLAWLLLLLAVPCTVFAQGGPLLGITFGPNGTPKGGVTVTVCAMSATVVNNVCTPAENDANCCFTDYTLSVHLTPPTGGGTILSSGLGNYTVWAAPGLYNVSFSGAGVVSANQLLAVSCPPGGTGCGNSVVATVALTGQTGSIGSTTLLASAPAGNYRVSVDLICTTSGAVGTLAQTTSWNNGTTAASFTTGSPLSLAAQGELPGLAGNFYVAAGQNITWSTTVTGGAGAQYAVRIKLEYLGP